MTLGDILDGMFRLLRQHWRAFALGVGSIILPSMVIIGIITIALMGALGLRMFGTLDGAADPFLTAGQMLAGGALILIVVYVLILTVSALLNGVAVHVAATGYRTGQAVPWDSVKAAFRRTFALLGAILLQAIVAVVIVGLPAIPLVLLGGLMGDSPGLTIAYGVLVAVALAAWALIVGARLTVVTPALMVEGVGPATALQRSNELVKGRTGWVIGTLLVTTLVSMVAYFVMYLALALLGFAVGQLSEALRLIISFVGAFALYTLMIALAGSAQALIYFDRRIRKEGYDLTEMAGQLGAPPQPSW